MKSRDKVFESLFAASVWLWTCGNLVYVAALAGSLDHRTLATISTVLVLGLGVLAYRAHAARAACARLARGHPLLLAAIASVVLIEAILGMAPPTARDALIQHLALPKLFVRAGGYVDLPFALHAAYPQVVDMLYVLPVGLGLDRAAALVHLALGLLSAGVLSLRAARWAGDRAALLVAIFFLSLPAVVQVAGAAYVDLGVCLFVFLAIESFLRWREGQRSARGLWWSGVALGCALSIKYSALVAAAALGVLALLDLTRGPLRSRTIPILAFWCLLVLAPAAPWLLRNAWTHHDPFYPLMTGLFGGEPQVQAIPGPLVLRHMMYGEGTFAIAALPIRMFLSGAENDPRRFDGRLNPLLPLLAAMPLFLRVRRVPSASIFALVLFSLTGILLSLVFVAARVRYLLPYVGPLCLLAVLAAESGYREDLPWRRIAKAVLMVALAWNGAFLLRTVRDPDLLGYWTGRVSRETYLTRRVAAYPLYMLANRTVPADGKVQLVFTGDQGYYLDVPYTYESCFSGSGIARALPEGNVSVENYFHRRGVTHLLLNERLLREFLVGQFGPEGVRRWADFARRRTAKLGARGPYALYELLRTPERPGPAEGRGGQYPPVPTNESGPGGQED